MRYLKVKFVFAGKKTGMSGLGEDYRYPKLVHKPKIPLEYRGILDVSFLRLS